MRIIIKEPDSKKGFNLVLPYHMMINLAVRKTWVKMGLKGKHKELTESDKKALAYVEAIDFGELRSAMHDLSIQKGIVIVEVAASDGTFVQITT